MWPIPLFHARRPKFRLRGKSTLKKRLVAKFFGFEALDNRWAPFCGQKRPFKALHAQLRLTDTDLAATRSYRQTVALTSVFCGIQKINPAGKAILWPIYTNISVKKKRLFGHFWKAILADSVTVRT